MKKDREERWIPMALVVGALAIVVAHMVPLVQGPATARTLRAQRNFLESLLQYERALNLFDDNLRAQILAPERPELRRKKAELVRQVGDRVEALVEEAPGEGPIVPALLELAIHWKRKVIPESAAVESQARAPGDWGSFRFREEYAQVRNDHAQRLREISEQAQNMASSAFESGQRQLYISAGACLLLWSSTLVGLVVRQHFQSRSRPNAPVHHGASSDRTSIEPHGSISDGVGSSDVQAAQDHSSDAAAEPAEKAQATPGLSAAASTPATAEKSKDMPAETAVAGSSAASVQIVTPADPTPPTGSPAPATPVVAVTPTPTQAPTPVAASVALVPEQALASAAQKVVEPVSATSSPVTASTVVSPTSPAAVAPTPTVPASGSDTLSGDDIARLLSEDPPTPETVPVVSSPAVEPVTAVGATPVDAVSVEDLLKLVEKQEANIPISTPSLTAPAPPKETTPADSNVSKSDMGTTTVPPASTESTASAGSSAPTEPKPATPSMAEMVKRAPAMTADDLAAMISGRGASVSAPAKSTNQSAVSPAAARSAQEPAVIQETSAKETESAAAAPQTIRGSDVKLVPEGAPAGPLDLSF